MERGYSERGYSERGYSGAWLLGSMVIMYHGYSGVWLWGRMVKVKRYNTLCLRLIFIIKTIEI